MGFLDTIGQRGPESGAAKSRPNVVQRLGLEDPAPAIQPAPAPASTPAPTPEPAQSNRVHSAVIWSATLIVAAAVATAAWLGMRHFPNGVAPSTEASADVPLAVQTHTGRPGPKQRSSAAPLVAAPVAPKNENEVDTSVLEARAETASDAASVPTIGGASHVPTATDTEGSPIETVSEPIDAALPAALPEDDYVYSSEGAGVAAPRLLSLGFIHPLLTGFEARTSTLELLVSKSGTVERAKIFSTSQNWDDAMLLSRAKTFQFVPAQRNGVPVRYRLIMKVDATP